MKYYSFVIRFAFIAVLMLTGCKSPYLQQPEKQTAIEIIETNINPISFDETIHMNNCGGKGDSEQIVERSFSTAIEGGANFKVGAAVVEGSISGKYGEFKNTTKSQKLIAPPGTDMEFVLRWSEEVRGGNVTVEGEQKIYKVRIPISVELLSSRDLGCTSGQLIVPTAVAGEKKDNPNPLPPADPPSNPSEGPFRDQKITPIVGTGVLSEGSYSDGMASYSEGDVTSHLNIQRIRLEENPDGCSIAYMDADRIWFGSSVKTALTINDDVVGEINGPTGKHGYIFNVAVHSGDKLCVTYFEPSGFMIVFGPDVYYHYDSYCYRGNC